MNYSPYWYAGGICSWELDPGSCNRKIKVKAATKWIEGIRVLLFHIYSSRTVRAPLTPCFTRENQVQWWWNQNNGTTVSAGKNFCWHPTLCIKLLHKTTSENSFERKKKKDTTWKVRTEHTSTRPPRVHYKLSGGADYQQTRWRGGTQGQNKWKVKRLKVWVKLWFPGTGEKQTAVLLHNSSIQSHGERPKSCPEYTPIPL